MHYTIVSTEAKLSFTLWLGLRFIIKYWLEFILRAMVRVKVMVRFMGFGFNEIMFAHKYRPPQRCIMCVSVSQPLLQYIGL